MNPQTITFQPRRRESKSLITVAVDALCYIIMHRNYAEVHLQNGKVFTSRITMEELEQTLGEDFLKVHRSCLVSIRSIYSIEDKIILNNGEQLDYVVRQKKGTAKTAAHLAESPPQQHGGHNRACQRCRIPRLLQEL